jgi:hypothetical protein
MTDDNETIQERIPIELMELIKLKPEITYLLLKRTTGYLFSSIAEKTLNDDEIDQIIWNYLNAYETGNVEMEMVFRPEEIN